ncbi:hypothetical protein AVEN_181156-1 [Araneus ventricosus]|uniref:Uncharacterized protein n=1 Tax=Araneus ventricosus TaxID=182803 RepID=A0A4Y2NGH9_ARAVE|nr:hypothetical protein AVEN_6872-1 [Araneus ventricosus]GBN69134.1 hypothetical protein AVEN_181156-1 [Araneus ventricosus]
MLMSPNSGKVSQILFEVDFLPEQHICQERITPRQRVGYFSVARNIIEGLSKLNGSRPLSKSYWTVVAHEVFQKAGLIFFARASRSAVNRFVSSGFPARYNK